MCGRHLTIRSCTDIQQPRHFLLRGKFVRQGPTRCTAHKSQFILLAVIINLVYHAVDIVGQGLPFIGNTPVKSQAACTARNLLYLGMIGVRMALGARSHNVRAMVLKQVSQMTAIGGMIGIVGAYFIGRFAQSLLFGLDGGDPYVMVGVASLLAIVAFGAGYLPARKASRVDPVHALRYE